MMARAIAHATVSISASLSVISNDPMKASMFEEDDMKNDATSQSLARHGARAEPNSPPFSHSHPSTSPWISSRRLWERRWTASRSCRSPSRSSGAARTLRRRPSGSWRSRSSSSPKLEVRETAVGWKESRAKHAKGLAGHLYTLFLSFTHTHFLCVAFSPCSSRAARRKRPRGLPLRHLPGQVQRGRRGREPGPGACLTLTLRRIMSVLRGTFNGVSPTPTHPCSHFS